MTPDNEPQPVRIVHAVRLREPIWTGIYLAIGAMMAVATLAVAALAVAILIGAIG